MSEEKMESNISSGSSFPKPLAIIVVIAAIAALVYFFATSDGNGGVNHGIGDAVAVVNGQEITQSQYDERYAQLAAVVESQGQLTTGADIQELIKSQATDSLIVEAVLLDAAEKDGMTANEDEISAEFANSKSQFPDDAAFQEALIAEGYTEETLMEGITKNNIIQQYLDANVDDSSITATDEEIQDLYDQSIIGSENVPALEEVRSQVEAQVVLQKRGALLDEFIQELRDSSDIEILI